MNDLAVLPVAQPKNLLRVHSSFQHVQKQPEALLALSAQHPVGVFQALIGHEGYVGTADDHLDARGTRAVCQFIGGRCGGGDGGNAQQIGFFNLGESPKRLLATLQSIQRGARPEGTVHPGNRDGTCSKGPCSGAQTQAGEDTTA